VLDFFGITLDDLRIAGGLLVAHAAWGMLNNESRMSLDEHNAAADKTDILQKSIRRLRSPCRLADCLQGSAIETTGISRATAAMEFVKPDIPTVQWRET
jgi:hypothetical protein